MHPSRNPVDKEEILQSHLDLYSIWMQTGRIVTQYYDIKYAAGISKTGLDYYRHHSLDDYMTIDGKQVDYDFLWWVHETTEQRFIQFEQRRLALIVTEAQDPDLRHRLSKEFQRRIHYDVAHQTAQDMEYTLVSAMDIDPVAYTEKCNAFIKYCADHPLQNSPIDLDLYPYEDEHDMDALKEIEQTGGPVSYMLLPVSQHGGQDGRPFWES
jgi:hypothetical protein